MSDFLCVNSSFNISEVDFTGWQYARTAKQMSLCSSKKVNETFLYVSQSYEHTMLTAQLLNHFSANTSYIMVPPDLSQS